MPGKGEIMKRWTNKIKNKQYGQAMVEFALTLPVFLLAVIGVIELSRFFLVYSSVYTASREASRYGTSVGEDKTLPNYMNCTEIATRAQDMGFFGGVNAGEVVVYYESTPGTKLGDCGTFEPKLGDRLVVEAQAEYIPLIAGFVLPDGITVSATNGRTIMKEIKLESTPIPIPLCSDEVKFNGTPASDLNNKTYSVFVKNISTETHYELIGAVVSSYDSNNRLLDEIFWSTNSIWKRAPSEGQIFPNFIWSSQYNKILYAGDQIPIRFIFSLPIKKDSINLKFSLTFQNTTIRTKTCVLYW